MQTRELQAMNSQEINGFISEMERKLFDERLNHASASLQDTDSLRRTRRAIARAKTILAQKEAAN
ncbi:MAG: 50S ribosomal protein L29 [Myxococcota bacterium]|nr:50S ribosomal protein L29 [Myxococcota bacterium]